MNDSVSPGSRSVGADIEMQLHAAAQWQLHGDVRQAEAAYLRVLELQPRHADALHMLGVIATQSGDGARAVALISAAIAAQPNQAGAYSNLGNALLALGRYQDALASLDRALELRPKYPVALLNRGIALIHLGQHEAALVSLSTAAGDGAFRVPALFNRAVALAHLARPAESLADYDQVLALAPEHLQAARNRAGLLAALGRSIEALAAYQRVLARAPADLDALNGRGLVLLQFGRHEEARCSFAAAIDLDPTVAHAHNNLGLALRHLKLFDAALASVDHALRLNPQFPEALNNRGWILASMARHEEAIVSLEQALGLRADFPQALTSLAAIARLRERYPEATDYIRRALALDPDGQDALGIAGGLLIEAGQYAEAIAVLKRLISIAPENESAPGDLLAAQLRCCDWSGRSDMVAGILEGIAKGRRTIKPLLALAVTDDPALQLACARGYGEYHHLQPETLPLSAVPTREDKLRVAYVSGDFEDHAVSYLTAGVFEQHDRAGFEIVAISLRPPRHTQIGQRLRKAFDRFEDLALLSDRATALRMRELNVHIAVDLSGYTGVGRVSIFSHRPAPVQVNYLGFPGTMGLTCMDYIIADEFVIPTSAQTHYSEQVVYLPHTFQANDGRRQISSVRITRQHMGLPDHGLVLCSFNNSYKVNPAFFAIWMRILAGCPESVLWLLAENELTEHNLRREARAAGISPGRLVFARRLPYAQHLARLKLADLFLDGLPFNAGTTASDALWAGVPVLTCAGASFAGRMAGSLLRAVGLPELITYALEDYETLALRLARNRDLLASLRARLAANSASAPLFDTPGFCRSLEYAYSSMWERYLRGDPPRGFSVPHQRGCFDA